ncbi:MAG: hypothetical protein MJ211_08585 [Bacteroidales bacterium]|nr:hypothetical protein [Bacteroidales bacterium]
MLEKISKYLLIVLFVISAILLVMFYAQVVPLEETEQLEHSTTSLFLNWSYILFVIAAVATIVSLVKNCIDKPKVAITLGIGVATLAIIFFVSYAISSDSLDSITTTLVQTTPGELKFSEAGLYTTYAVLALNVIAILWLEISAKVK